MLCEIVWVRVAAGMRERKSWFYGTTCCFSWCSNIGKGFCFPLAGSESVIIKISQSAGWLFPVMVKL